MTRIVHLSEHQTRRQAAPVYFNRAELNLLLGMYSARVAKGEWRDYAIGHEPGLARFSVFRHAHETPLYTITKRWHGGEVLYALFAGDRRTRQSARLETVLAALDKPLKVVRR